MKADIHPDYHEVIITQTDGTEFKTRSCMGKPGEKMRLDVDPLSHPAWQGGTQKVVEKQQLKKFENKYGSFLSGNAGREDAAAAADTDRKKS